MSPSAILEEKTQSLNNSPGSEVSKRTSGTDAWTVVSRWLTGTNQDVKVWGELIGPHISTMTLEANYGITRQFEAQIFLYSQVLPRLGRAPSSKSYSHWQSLLTNDGTPIEYSWKWNSPSGSPEVRYCIEGISSDAGRANDAHNYRETKQLVKKLATIIPDFDITLFDHFTEAFHLDDPEKLNDQPQEPISSCLLLSSSSRKESWSRHISFRPETR